MKTEALAPSAPRAIDYDWAVLRVVPRVHLGSCVNVAVLVHARTEEFLDMLALTDEAILAARTPGVDAALLSRYLEACVATCRGESSEGCGPSAVSLAPPSERFHWLTAPRSDVLQASPVHGGITHDPAETLRRLFDEQVGS